jgi:hypothetical protein
MASIIVSAFDQVIDHACAVCPEFLTLTSGDQQVAV